MKCQTTYSSDIKDFTDSGSVHTRMMQENARSTEGDGNYSESGCSLEMFGGDSNAYWACVTEYALQTNWFPSPVAGLYIK